MAEVQCGSSLIGTPEGVTRLGWSKSVKWKNLGHWDDGRWITDCRLCESVDVTHNAQTYGSTPSTPVAHLTGASYLVLTEFTISAGKQDMWQAGFTWKEMFGSELCPLNFVDIEYDVFPTCSWGISGYYTTFSYKKTAEIDMKTGPSGLDGSDEDNPLTAYVSARYKQTVETLSFSTNVEEDNPTVVTISSAFGGASISLSDAKLVSEQKQASSQDFTVWSYTLEKISEM